MSSLAVNQHFALSDHSIAIAQDDKHNVIYIYPITKEEKDDAKTAKKRRIAEQPRKDNYRINTDDPSRIKKLYYSGELMDVNYSSRFISMSKDGRYLAISWLPNPRLGINSAMKYCVVFDLDRMDKDNLVSKIPCAIMEFCGGSVFTQDGKFVLIHADKVLVYAIGDGKFTLDFTLNLSAGGSKDEKTFEFFPSSTVLTENEIISKLNSSSLTNAAVDDDNFDDIFFDNSGDEMWSDLEEDQSDKNDDQWIKANSLPLPEEKGERVDPFQLFLDNDRFIRNSVDTIKDYGVVSLISSFPHQSESYNLLSWSLEEKRTIFEKRVKSNGRYLTSFTKYKNLVAFSKKYGSDSHNLTSHQVLGTADTPLSTIYDCASGVAVGDYCLPQGRKISRLSQVVFIQDDMYLLTVSHDAEHTYFDLWDVLSTTHLDTHIIKSNENQVCKDYSQFVLNDQLPLTAGCGLYMHVEYQHPEAIQDSLLSTCYFDLSVVYVSFFEEDGPVLHGCQCGKATYYEMKDGKSTLTPRVTSSITYNPAITTAACNSFFFLDKEHNYMMASHWDPDTAGVDLLMMVVYKVTHTYKRELACETFSQDHDLHVGLTDLKYAFMLNRKVFMRRREGMAGYATMFLDMEAVRSYCLKHLSARMMLHNNNTPVLVLQLNYYKTIKDISLGFLKKGNEDKQRSDPYFAAVPLHSFSALESRLHALASQNVVSLFDKDGVHMRDFHRTDYLKLISSGQIIQTSAHFKLDKTDLMSKVDSSSAYFSTMAGYATLCRLAKSDEHYQLLDAILKDTTKINYCTLRGTHTMMDPLGEALHCGALKNAQLFAYHIQHCMDTYGTEYGHLLLKHSTLLPKHFVNTTRPPHRSPSPPSQNTFFKILK
ncbi:unnamed protein product [Mucor hiemalis]